MKSIFSILGNDIIQYHHQTSTNLNGLDPSTSSTSSSLVTNNPSNLHLHYHDSSLNGHGLTTNSTTIDNGESSNLTTSTSLFPTSNTGSGHMISNTATKTKPSASSKTAGLGGAYRGKKSASAATAPSAPKYTKKGNLKFNKSSNNNSNPFQSESSAAAAAAAAYFISTANTSISSSSSLSSSSSTTSSVMSFRHGGGASGSSKRKRKRVLNRLQRAEATMREKRRMLKLNRAFEDLRKVLPSQQYAPKNKLSRAETLKGAIEHIDYLSKLLSIS